MLLTVPGKRTFHFRVSHIRTTCTIFKNFYKVALAFKNSAQGGNKLNILNLWKIQAVIFRNWHGRILQNHPPFQNPTHTTRMLFTTAPIFIYHVSLVFMMHDPLNCFQTECTSKEEEHMHVFSHNLKVCRLEFQSQCTALQTFKCHVF